MSFKTIAGGFIGGFWWYGPLSEDREILKQIYQNYIVALACRRWFAFAITHITHRSGLCIPGTSPEQVNVYHNMYIILYSIAIIK